MKRIALALTLLLAAHGNVTAQAPSTTPDLGLRNVEPRSVRIVNATVVPAPGKRIENGMLLIRDGVVVAVGSQVDSAAGVPDLDLEGAWIYPGFVEPYSEYGLGHVDRLYPRRSGPRSAQYEGTRAGGNASNDAIHAEKVWSDAFRPDEKAAKALMKRGVTTAMSVKQDGIFRGRGFVASLEPGLPGERLLVGEGPHFGSFDKGTSGQSYPSSLMGSIALVRQTLLDAAWYRDARRAAESGGKWSMPEFNRAIRAVSDNDGAIVFESDDVQTLFRAQRISEEFSVPMIHVGGALAYADATRLAEAGIRMILPLKFPDAPSVGTFEDRLDVDLRELRDWERAPTTPATLEDAGVRFALTGHGLDKQDLLKNLRKAVKHGLSPDTALAALTSVPAEFAGVERWVGALTPGKRADLVVADGDLFDAESKKASKIVSVWIRGREIERFEPRRGADLTGTYEIDVPTLGDAQLVLKDDEKFKGQLQRGDAFADLKSLKRRSDRIEFRIDLKEFDREGLAVVTLWRIGGDLQGTVTMPDGRSTAVALVKKSTEAEFAKKTRDDSDSDADSASKDDASTEAEAEESSEEAADDDTTLISRLTLPNAAYGAAALPQREDVMVRNATLWTLEGEGKLEQADLWVADGKIRKIGQSLKAPRGVRVIDGTGLHVTPGMIDEHSHISISRGVNEGSNAVTAEVRIGDVVDGEDVSMYRALAGGVTASQLLHGSANPIGGQAQVVKLRWGRPAEELKFSAAPPSIKFALGENVKQSNRGGNNQTRYPQSRMGVETLIRDRLNRAREYESAWKKFRGLSNKERQSAIPPRRDLQLETMLEILNSERFVHCHSYVQSEILMLMRLAEDYGFRIQTFTHILEGYKVAPEMAKHGAGASTFSDWWAYKFEVYDAIPYNTCLMTEAGVVTSINSDSGEVIRRLNQEAGKSVAYCDMDEVEALKLATLNPAKQLKIDHRVGSLAPGKDADFVIWNGHPLSVKSKTLQTWVDGTPYFTIERDAQLRQEMEAEKQALIQKALSAGGADSKGKGKGGTGRRPWHCEDVEDVWNP